MKEFERRCLGISINALKLRYRSSALGAQRNLYGIGEDIDALKHPVTGFRAEFDIRSRHFYIPNGKLREISSSA